MAAVSRIELAVEKVKHLDENQAEALLEWVELRDNREALRQKLDAEIELGLEQLKRGEQIPGEQVHAEILERSRRRHAGGNGRPFLLAGGSPRSAGDLGAHCAGQLGCRRPRRAID